MWILTQLGMCTAHKSVKLAPIFILIRLLTACSQHSDPSPEGTVRITFLNRSVRESW